ncbi:ComF family protein [Cognatishimia activa]|nr:ComF family protein [Cognatishimia activa]
MTREQVQTAVQMIFPPRCVACGVHVESDFQLCGSCWRETPFIGGAICDRCGIPLPGQVSEHQEVCDDCMTNDPLWSQGRSVLLYEGAARSLVLRLKHGDRHDIARPAARWMAAEASPIVSEVTIVAPIPLHWTRFLRRRYNQSALLAERVAKELSLQYIPDLLLRTFATASLDGKTREERFLELRNAISVNSKHLTQLKTASVLLVDDVMTSGATFSAATEACLHACADQVNVIALARVAKHP